MLEPDSPDCKSQIRRITDKSRISPRRAVLFLVGCVAIVAIVVQATTWGSRRGNLLTEAPMGNLDISKAVNAFGSTLFKNFDEDVSLYILNIING